MLFAAARGAEIDWDAEPDLDRFLYTFAERMSSVFLALVPLMRVSVSWERVGNSGTPMRVPEYCKAFASCGMLKAYACKAWKRFNGFGEDLTSLPAPDTQDAPIAGEKEFIAVKPGDAPGHDVDADELLIVDKNDDRELEGAVGLDVAEHVELKRKLCELQ